MSKVDGAFSAEREDGLVVVVGVVFGERDLVALVSEKAEREGSEPTRAAGRGWMNGRCMLRKREDVWTCGGAAGCGADGSGCHKKSAQRRRSLRKYQKGLFRGGEGGR